MLARSDNHSQTRAQQLRSRAEEIRGAAEGMQSIPARTTMLHIAETWMRLAKDAESAANGHANGVVVNLN